MQYRINPKNGDSISQLGLGCMRLPRRGTQIDQAKTNDMVAHAIEQGINYFDTAHMYPGSEEALGTALAALGKRDQVFIASKLPIIQCKKPEDFDKIFSTELARLKTDHIDYYLMHMLCNVHTWERLKGLGIEAWIAEKKKSGAIRNIGFSFHGGKLDFRDLVDAYPWEFCMIQLNYLDENNQAGYSGMQYAHGKGLPVFVMEPLRGGSLVNGLPEAAQAVFRKANPKRSLAEWGLRWIFDRPEMTCALSGMSTMAQLEENIKIAADATPGHLGDAEQQAYVQAVAAINRTIRIPCTGCGYCVPCPRGVNIPACFASYNETYTGRYIPALARYMQSTGAFTDKPADASLCVKCGKCESHCPQQIKITELLPKVNRRMLTTLTRPLVKLGRSVMSTR